MTNSFDVKLKDSWNKHLSEEFDKPYMQELKLFLLQEKRAGKSIYPKEEQLFNALNLTPFDEVKVVILGQDPYHGPNQAHGLCFSVQLGVKTPPSLRTIYKELKHDLNIQPASHGFLESWARQGILLLNTVLTVEEGKPGSHRGKGWEQFTDQIIIKLNARNKPIIFVLWGSHAQRKEPMIDQAHHYVLKSPHPSPLSAYQGFLGNQHFSTINKILHKEGMSTIEWQLPELNVNPS